MIQTNGRYEAAFKQTINEKTVWHRKPVEAWDEEGHALVLDPDAGQLRRARSYRNFDGVSEANDPVVAAIPGSGWRVEWTNGDGTTWTEHLLAWAVDSSGWAKPIDGDVDGNAMPLDEMGKNWRLIPPLASDPA